jgi:hypothetical protein
VLHFVLAALVLTWHGIGLTQSPPVVPAIVAHPSGGRVPARSVLLQAYEGRAQVVADYSVTPANAIVFSAIDPMGVAGYANDSYALAGRYRGPAIIQARYGRDSATLPAFVYDSLYVSCYMGASSNGVRFDTDGVAQNAGTPAESDIYETGPANSPEMDIHRGCTGAFINPAATTSPVHVPYGGTVVAGIYFGNVSVRAWRNDFTIVPELRVGDVLLFKTKDGRVVKVLVYPGAEVSGAYITGPPRGDFFDYVTWHPKRKSTR